MTDDDDKETLKRRLHELQIEHRDLDDVIARLADMPDADQLQIQRMKKRKLALKDMITRIESKLIPDLDA